MISIPLVDLSAQHAAVAEEVAEGWRQVLAATAFIGGPQVAAFECEYAAFIGVSALRRDGERDRRDRDRAARAWRRSR